MIETCETLESWTYEDMESWTYEDLESRIYEDLESRTYEELESWTCEIRESSGIQIRRSWRLKNFMKRDSKTSNKPSPRHCLKSLGLSCELVEGLWIYEISPANHGM
jgi:hypothetical protein